MRRFSRGVSTYSRRVRASSSLSEMRISGPTSSGMSVYHPTWYARRYQGSGQ